MNRDDDDRIDTELRQAVGTLEDRATLDGAWASGLERDLRTRIERGRRPATWVLAAAAAVLVLAAGAAAGAVLVVVPDLIGGPASPPASSAPEPSPSPSPSLESASPSQSATASPTASPTPTLTPATPTPAPTAPSAAWRDLPHVPSDTYGIESGGAVGPDGRFWMVGVSSQQLPIESEAAILVFDPTSGAWEVRPGLNYSGIPQAAFGADGYLWVFAGDGSTGLSASAYDTSNATWVRTTAYSPLGSPRVGAWDGAIYLTGSGRFGPALVRFDTGSARFTQLADPPAQLVGLAANDDRLVGIDDLGRTWRYTVGSDGWEEGSPSGMEGVSSQLVSVDGGRVVLVGEVGPGGLDGSTRLYDIDADRWFDLPDVPTPRRGPAIGWIPDVGVMVAGGVGESDRRHPCRTPGGVCSTPLLVDNELLEIGP